MRRDTRVSTRGEGQENRHLVDAVEPRLRHALTALYGPERGREATSEALEWAFAHFQLCGRSSTADDEAARLRRLFAEGRARSASLRAPSLFDEPAALAADLDRRVAGLLSVMPMRDRVALLLIEGAAWTPGDVADLFGTVENRVLRSEQRWLPALQAAVAPDELSEVLRPLFSGGAQPVSGEELAERGAAISRDRPGTRKAVGTSVAVLVLLVGGIVLALAATRSATDSGYTTPGALPKPGRLADSVIVIPNLPQSAGYRTGLRAVYEVDAGTRRPVAMPVLPRAAAASIPAATGSWLVEIQYRNPLAGGAGEAVAWRSGSTTTHRLGPASTIHPGLQQGTVWLARNDVASSDPPKAGCQVSLIALPREQLVPPTRISCDWQILGAVKGGLLVLTRAGATEIWDPTARTVQVLPGVTASSVRAAGRTLLAQQWDSACSATCFVTLAAPATGAVHTVRLVPPRGQSLTTQLSLSPNGQFLAVTAMPINEAIATSSRPFVGPTPASEGIHGQLVVIRVPTGQVAMARPVTFLQPSLVEWAPDGSYVFLTKSRTDIEAVPAWSVTVPIETIAVAARLTNPPNAGERFLVVGR